MTDLKEESGEKFPDLESFRAEWRRELGDRSGESPASDREFDPIAAPLPVADEENNVEEDIHTKAREYFLEGVRLEERGKLYDAVQFYKKAVALVPDIENETFLYTGRQACDNKNRNVEATGQNMEGVEDNHEAEHGNLVDEFSRINLDNHSLIQTESSQSAVHIGDIPMELLIYILKWVVSSDLDLCSLESCSAVCRGFYLAARDQEIWRLVCVRVWGVGILSCTSNQTIWRDLYISKPRANFNGCYISKMTYIREGERGFQDSATYKAWHVVEYYRFIRLFPGGRAMMVLSADDPGLIVKLMNNRNICSVQGAMFGEYRIVDDVLFCILNKSKPKKPAQKFRRKRRDSMVYHDVPDQEFLLEFYIKGPRFQKLFWRNYKILSKYSNGSEQLDIVNLNEKEFPRLVFSPVRSYHFESYSPL